MTIKMGGFHAEAHIQATYKIVKAHSSTLESTWMVFAAAAAYPVCRITSVTPYSLPEPGNPGAWFCVHFCMHRLNTFG